MEEQLKPEGTYTFKAEVVFVFVIIYELSLVHWIRARGEVYIIDNDHLVVSTVPSYLSYLYL